jgi:hypothetical protein
MTFEQVCRVIFDFEINIKRWTHTFRIDADAASREKPYFSFTVVVGNRADRCVNNSIDSSHHAVKIQ